MNHDPPVIPLDRHCQVIAYDKYGIWAFEKAPGVLSHPNPDTARADKRKGRTLLNAPYLKDEEAYCWEDAKGNTSKLYLVHRLDSPTSGVILATSSKELATSIKESFANRRVSKTYHAIVIPSRKPFRNAEWKDNLTEKRDRGKIRVTRGNGPIAITKAIMERENSGLYGLSLLKLAPQTGRTHQLRVQCALRNIPIVGDRNYGNFSMNRKFARASKIDRLCLHASKVELSVRVDGKLVNFTAEAPLPRSFGKLLS
jgi:tRNA pseudouridine65 synthase